MMTLAASAVRFLCERAVRIYCKTIGIREVTKKVNDLVRRRGWEGVGGGGGVGSVFPAICVPRAR